MDEIDRILSADETSEPSPGFVARVMAAVEDESVLPAPIPFPWKRAVVVVSFGVGVAVVAGLSGGLTVGWDTLPPVGDRLAAPFTTPAAIMGFACAGGAIFLSWAVARLASRLAPSGV